MPTDDLTLTLRDARGVAASCPLTAAAVHEDGSVVAEVRPEEAADVLAMVRRQGPYDCAESHDVEAYTLAIQVESEAGQALRGVGPVSAEVLPRCVALTLWRPDADR